MVDQIIVVDQMIEGLNLEIPTNFITIGPLSVEITKRPEIIKINAIVHQRIRWHR